MRNIIREVLRDMRKQGYNQKHILLIGYSRAAEQYIDRIKANPEWGYIVERNSLIMYQEEQSIKELRYLEESIIL